MKTFTFSGNEQGSLSCCNKNHFIAKALNALFFMLLIIWFEGRAQSPLSLTCPGNDTVAACQPQHIVDSAYNAWLASATVSGGCDNRVRNSGKGEAPSTCGGTTTVVFTATDCKGHRVTCSASFTVMPAVLTPIVLSCPANETVAACQSQHMVDSLYHAWLASATVSGGCDTKLHHSERHKEPASCGGTDTIVFTATDCSGNSATCSATFVVLPAVLTPIVLTCPANDTVASCQSQHIVDSLYAAWLASVTVSGGCNTRVWNSGGWKAPAACGGTSTVNFYATDCSDSITTCAASFTVMPAVKTPIVLTCPANDTVASCQSQSAIDSEYSAWLTMVTVSGGCNPRVWNSGFWRAPASCGGTAVVNFYATDCSDTIVTCSSNFTVLPAPAPIITTPASDGSANCADSSFSGFLAWLNSNGGAVATSCRAIRWTNNFYPVPVFAHPDSVTVTFTASDGCGNRATTSATFRFAIPPAINCANSMTVACGTAVAFTPPTVDANGNSGISLTVVSTDTTINRDCSVSYVRTWQITDSCGDVATCSQNITVRSCSGRCDNNKDEEIGINNNVPAISEMLAYPNPALSSVNFTMAFTHAMDNVSLEIFNLEGQRVAEIYTGSVIANQDYHMVYNIGSLPAGTYFYRLDTPDGVNTDKIVIMQ